MKAGFLPTVFFFLLTNELLLSFGFRTVTDDAKRVIISPMLTSTGLTESSVSENEAAHVLHSILVNEGQCSKVSVLNVLQAKDDIILIKRVVDNVFSKAFSEVNSEREALKTISDDLSLLETELIRGFENILDSECFSCSRFMNKINDVVQSMVTTLEKRFPHLQEEFWFQTALTFVNAVISTASEICGEGEKTLPIIDINDFSPKLYKKGMNWAGLLLAGQTECLSKEQKDDVEEVLQLAGNLLNTFSQWLRESEAKAQSKEFKFVIEKLAAFLDKERSFIENSGADVIETGCEKCAQLVEFASEIVNLGETILKTIVPFWKIIPYLEDALNSIDDFLAKAREICPYQFQQQGLGNYQYHSISCLSRPFAISAEATRIAAAGLLDNLDAVIPPSTESHVLRIHFGGEQTCFSCNDVLNTLDTFLNQIESVLDKLLPQWRSLPFVDVVDNFIHETITNLEGYCPDMLVLKKYHSSFIRIHHNSLGREIQQALQDVRIALESFKAGAEFDEDSLNEGLVNSITDSVAIVAASLTNTKGFLCDETALILQKIISGLEKLEQIIDTKEINFILDFLKSKLAFVLDIITKKCANQIDIPDSESLRIEMMTNLLQLTDYSSDLKDMAGVSGGLRGYSHVINSELAFSCKTFIMNVEDIISKIESTLSVVFPAWQSLPLLPELDNFVHEVLDFMGKECGGKVKRLIQFSLVQHASGVTEALHCLTEDEKHEVTKASLKAEKSLNAIAGIVEIRAAIEADPLKKLALKESAKVIRTVSSEVLQNATALADEFCGSCTELVHATEDIFLTVENAMSDVEPEWRESPVFAGIKHITQSTFTYLDGFCFKVDSFSEEEHCLTPEERTTLKGYVSTADSVLTYAANLLDEVAGSFTDGDLKQEIMESATAIKAVDKELVKNFTKIADETCGSCGDIFKGLEDFEQAVESALNDVDKEWRTNSNLNIVATSVETIISILKSLCPTAAAKIDEEKYFLKAAHLILSEVNILGYERDTKFNSEAPCTSDIVAWIMADVTNVNPASVDTSTDMLMLTFISASAKIQKKLEVMILVEPNADSKRELQVLADMFYLLESSINDLLIKHITDQNIFNCDTIINAVDSAVNEVKNLIEEIVPTLKNSEIFNQALNVIKIMLDILHDYCDSQ